MTSVIGEANFCMEKTYLTVGGFSQPSVARPMIEQSTSAEVGLTQRFLWIFPRPTYSCFHTLQEVDEDFTRGIGEYTVHMALSLSHFRAGLDNEIYIYTACTCTCMYTVSHLKNQWKQGRTKDPSPKVKRIIRSIHKAF